jgi:hypothetical protein
MEKSMDSINSSLNRQQYSNSSSKELKNTVTVTVSQVIKNLPDLIADDDYVPYYVARYKDLGYTRFMWLANKARIGRDPARLFWWMLHNPDVVR